MNQIKLITKAWVIEFWRVLLGETRQYYALHDLKSWKQFAVPWYHREWLNILLWNPGAFFCNCLIMFNNVRIQMFSGSCSEGNLPWCTDHWCNLLHTVTRAFSEFPHRWGGWSMNYFHVIEGQYLFWVWQKHEWFSRTLFGVRGWKEKGYGGTVFRRSSSASRDSVRIHFWIRMSLKVDGLRECQLFFFI